MVDYQPSDVLPMGEFVLSWRITDPQWALLPDQMLSHIKPLSSLKSRELYEKSPLSLPVGDPPSRRGYRESRYRSLEESGDVEGDTRIRRWFEELPIDPERLIYVCWAMGEGVAATTDWGTFLETWGDLWYPFDRLCVFDETRSWAVLFGPEEEVRFLEMSVQRTPA